MARITRAAPHLSVEEVKERMNNDPNPLYRKRWLIIYNVLIDPREAKVIAKHTGVSVKTVHKLISTYNRLGIAAVETPGKGGRRNEYLTLEEKKELRLFQQNFAPLVKEALQSRDPEDDRPVLNMAQDEACFGRISTIIRSWAPKHIRPLTPKQIVREYIYAYAVVAPKDGKMTSLILPSADTSMMNLFLQHVSRTFSKYFLVIQVDQA